MKVASFGGGDIGHQAPIDPVSLTMIRLSAAGRKISVKRTIGAAPEVMTSAST
jgi:hypothetical protein